jgi:uncharacterized protein involved in outer membrane biogenesis
MSIVQPQMMLQRYRKPLIGVAVAILFFLAPWLIKNTATNAVRDNLGVELKLQKVSVNPFVLSLQVDALELDEPNGDPFLTVERVFINFQLSSLFRWALTFRELHIDSPRLRLERDADGEFNFAIDSPRLRLERDADGEFNFAFLAQQAAVSPFLRNKRPNQGKTTRRPTAARRACSSRTSPLSTAASTGRMKCRRSLSTHTWALSIS